MAERAGWRSIARDLRDAITRGELRPGTQLPSQEELAHRYGVVRPTVTRALAALVDEGLVVSAKLRGSWVAHPPVRLAITRYSTVAVPDRERPDLGPWETACAEHGIAGNAELVAVERGPAPPAVAERLRLAAGAEVVRRDRRMWADSYVVQLQSAWYPASLADGTPLAGDGKVVGGVYAALVTAGVTPAVADEEVSARLATGAETEDMHIRERQPVLALWRTTRDGAGQPIEVVHIVASSAAVSLLYTDLPITRESS
jgi:GntR family transcriptional regulator